MRYASFFSGVGGFELALDAAGFERAFSCEIDGHCRAVFKARFGHEPEAGDIRALGGPEIPDVELFCGGWPCQGLSVAGMRKGLADERSGLFWELLRLVEQKRPRWMFLENVPGLLSTCSCPRCGRVCKSCGAPAGADDEACQLCGSERLGGRVLPGHRGTDYLVVLSAIQGLGYGVSTRILDAEYFGVPQRRNRLLFVCRLGAPVPPEILFEPEGGCGDPQEGGEEGKVAAGEVARSVGGVGGGNDPGAGKGTLVGAETAPAVTASDGHHGHSSPRGDGTDCLVPVAFAERTRGGVKNIEVMPGGVTPALTNPGKGGRSDAIRIMAGTVQPSPKADRGQARKNLVAGTLQGCGPGQGRKTPEPDMIVPATEGPAHAVSKGTGGGLGGRDGQDDYILVEGDSAASTPPLPRLRAGCGRAGEIHVLMPDKSGALCAGPEGHGHSMGSGRAMEQDQIVAAPITAGSHPNSNAPGRMKNDDINIVGIPTAVAFDAHNNPKEVTGTLCGGERAGGKNDLNCPIIAQPVRTNIYNNSDPGMEARGIVQQPLFIHIADGGANQNQVKGDGKADCCDGRPGAVAFEPRYYGDREKAGGKPAPMADITNCKKAGDSAPVICAPISPPVDGTASRTGQERTETQRIVGEAGMSLRRLTPSETERLQGFPDGHTCLCGVRPDCPERRVPPWIDRSKIILGGCGHSSCGCKCPDSNRYRTMGNAVAVPVIRWVADRLAAVAAREKGA